MSSMPNATVRCAPASAAIRGAIAAKTATDSAIGTNARPALVGENPRIPCR